MADFNSSLPVRTENSGDVISKICDATTSSQQLAVTAQGRAKAVVAGTTSGGTDTNLKVDSTGALFVIPADQSGNEVADYQTSAAVAAASSVNHDYTAINTFVLEGLVVSGSGKIKVEIKTGPVASLVSKAVLFNSTAQPTIVAQLPADIKVATGNICRFVITNEDKSAQDVYSTRLGRDS